ncbi:MULTISPECIES: OstA-like protein [unclassified Myroides]|uniref:OstA-like protein n=1 Tax=unclassified Myroides TaxID=2642485 RepID=UPI003D2F91B8
MRTLYFFILFTLVSFSSFSQDKNKIIIHHADLSDRNQAELPDATLLRGNITAEHNGIILNCNTAYYFEKENYIKLLGDVRMNQGDTLFLDSKYAEYNAINGFAYAEGDVIVRSPDSTLETDTLRFNRNENLIYYNTPGTIVNKGNTLKSKAGKYLLTEKKFQFFTAVTITTTQGTIVKSNHLDFYEVPEHAYVFGPSTITNEDDYIYTENGYYDVKQDLGKMVKNSYIWYDQRKIEGDSIYYNKSIEFASATNHVRITDTINKSKITGHYAELYKLQDSTFVTKKALVSMLTEEGDSVYFSAKRIVLTGPEKKRIIRGYHDARIFRDSMSGKADSIHWSEELGLTQMIGRPVLWNGDSQVTGEVMHMLSNLETKQMDSLKVLNNAFIVEKDTLGTGYNQVKGVNLYGKFVDNKLNELDLVKNAEMIYYAYNEKNEFIGIDKGICSHINVGFSDNEISSVTLFVAPESQLYPDHMLPENARFLKDFVWRGDEKINSLADIFSEEEIQEEEDQKEERLQKQKEAEEPMEIQKETLQPVAEPQQPLVVKKNSK